MTAGLSKNIMQANIERTRETKAMFAQVEIALNKIAFKSKDSSSKPIVDLTAEFSGKKITDLTGSFLSGHTSYTPSQLSVDQWNQKIYMFYSVENVALWGSSGGQKAEAPVTTLMLISAGPNRRYDTLVNSSIAIPTKDDDLENDKIKTIDLTDYSVVGDDIVIRFNNYEAMLDIWQRAEDLDNIVKNVSLDYYRSRLDAFSPLIQLSQRDVTSGLLGGDVFDNLDSNVEYDPFKNLGNDDDKSLTNEWNDSSNPIHDILVDPDHGFRKTPKEYDREFRLADYRRDIDGNIIDDEDNENQQLEFLATYGSVDFQYPSFDALEYDASGGVSSDQGFENIGVTNVSSMDPFAGIDGGIEHGYDYNEPEKAYIVRKSDTGDNKKWKIIKNVEIDGLGAL